MGKNKEDIVEMVLKQIVEKCSKIDFLDILLITTDIMSEIDDFGEDAIHHIDDICDKIYKAYPKYFKIEEKKETEQKTCKCSNMPQKKECACSSKRTNTHVADTETCKEIKILVPGVSKDNIILAVRDNVLTMKLTDVVIEQPFVNPDLSFEYELDETCDIEKISSTLDSGILTITIPKIEKKDNTRILTIL